MLNAQPQHSALTDAKIDRPRSRPTEVGAIPQDWERVTLRRISEFITKGSTPTTYGFRWETAGVLFLRSECVSPEGLDLTESMFISPAAHAMLRRSEVRDGDLLITITGNVGRVVQLQGVGVANINQHIARIRISSPGAHAGYVYHFLSQATVRKNFESITTGQAYPQISLRQVRDASVPLPQLPEQHGIAEALSDVDGLLGALEALIAKKRAIKQAAMQQLLTGKTRLARFSGEWERKRLGDVGYFLKGSGVRRADAQSGSLACVRYGEIYTTHDDYIRSFHSWISPEVAATATRLNFGDLLFAGSGETKEEIGKCVAFVLDMEAYAGGDIVILRPTNVDSLFLGYALNTADVARQKASLGQGDAVVHISSSALSQVSVHLPGIREQTAIATVVSDMDAEIAALEARCDKTRAIKQGMMQQLLTGRVRLVKPASTEASA